MASLPTNRGPSPLGTQTPAPVPTRVQGDSFGTRPAAPAGGTLAEGRVPQPRPAVTVAGSAQGRESFKAEEVGVSAARALNALQSKVASSTAQARANPLANGRLFQGVQITGTLTAGTLAQRPGRTGLPDGFMYFVTTTEIPYWLSGTDWIDPAGGTQATNGDALETTNIEHGFGRPAVGVIVTNVQNAVVQYTPRLVLAGDSTDNHIARVWFAYAPLSSASPTADVYVYY